MFLFNCSNVTEVVKAKNDDCADDSCDSNDDAELNGDGTSSVKKRKANAAKSDGSESDTAHSGDETDPSTEQGLENSNSSDLGSNGLNGSSSSPSPSPSATAASELKTFADQHVVFVSSKTFHGNLGGLAGADAKCLELARAAKFAGAWKAMLGDMTTMLKDPI